MQLDYFCARGSCVNPLPWLVLVLLISGCATQTPRHSHPAPRSVHTTITASYAATPLHRFYERWAGTPYRYGGQTQSGVDCSSFVQQAIGATESYELPRTTVGQARAGTRVPRSALERGDLVFFKTGWHSNHVGIYLGQGRFMHASSKKGVIISRLDNIYWRKHYWQARRLDVADNGARL